MQLNQNLSDARNIDACWSLLSTCVIIRPVYYQAHVLKNLNYNNITGIVK